jgi:hypothetical protein
VTLRPGGPQKHRFRHARTDHSALSAGRLAGGRGAARVALPWWGATLTATALPRNPASISATPATTGSRPCRAARDPAIAPDKAAPSASPSCKPASARKAWTSAGTRCGAALPARGRVGEEDVVVSLRIRLTVRRRRLDPRRGARRVCGLSSGLIHPCPEPFRGERRPPYRPGPVHSRPVADGTAQSSKACDAIARPPLRQPLPRLLPLPAVFRPPTGKRGGRARSCLSFCLIHLRPEPFTGGHPGHVRAGHGRWRTAVNAGQHCWKACWVQALASSNLASSAALTCKNTGEWPLTSGLILSCGLI